MTIRSFLLPGKSKQKKQQPLLSQAAYGMSFLLVCCLAIILSACTVSIPFITPNISQGAVHTNDPTITPTTVNTPTPTPTPVPPTITLQVTGCPSTLTINWDSLVGTKAGVNKVQKVACGSLEGAGSLVALVNVRYYTSDAKMDLHVYDTLTGTPALRFSVSNMLNGDALISPAGTIMTAEVGQNDLIKTARDVFKEYQWSNGSFVQVLFKGMYPEMTHYQAEQAQAQVAAGYNTWKLSPASIAAHIAQDVFHWISFSSKTTVYNQPQNIVTIQVSNKAPGGGGFTATFNHLDGVATNIYEMSQLVSIDGNATLTSPATGSQINSPLGVSGTYVVSGNLLGHVQLYNDTYITVGDSGAINSALSNGLVTFSTSVSYHLNQSGMQEGVVAFLPTSQNNLSLSNQAVMVKVFLNG